jgi:hypothetical protein
MAVTVVTWGDVGDVMSSTVPVRAVLVRRCASCSSPHRGRCRATSRCGGCARPWHSTRAVRGRRWPMMTEPGYATAPTSWSTRSLPPQFPLGVGLIHADAHHGNLVFDHEQGHWLLIDWDGTCIGPRELDLITGIPTHFHQPPADRTHFLTVYGYNILA